MPPASGSRSAVALLNFGSAASCAGTQFALAGIPANFYKLPPRGANSIVRAALFSGSHLAMGDGGRIRSSRIHVASHANRFRRPTFRAAYCANQGRKYPAPPDWQDGRSTSVYSTENRDVAQQPATFSVPPLASPLPRENDAPR